MKLGAVYPQTELKGDPKAVHDIGLAVEKLGYDHILVFDHVVGASHDREPKLWGPYTENHPFHDPFVMFGYWAGITHRLEMVTGVLILPQRQTVLVAQQAADVDLLSHQRLRLGIGTGWNYVEYHALGQDFETRGARADEQIPFLRRLWSEQVMSFDGKFDHIDKGNILPRPKRQIPIWVGGFTEPAFRRGGRLGDGYIFAGDIDHATQGWERVRHHLKESGRPEAGFGRELITIRATNLQETVDTVKRWRDLGGTHASINSMGKGFTTIEAHVDFMSEVRHRIEAGQTAPMVV
ncbi:LLM class F420-dependent oxidoreductase [Emcibacter sp. SYSU 3D8]|uniref:LLM class F420-dependent oxidoreductase n=1 Tax=Emcibacter sp. SYSU 3D8 TaxID=3133969 RepID=UPI0031FE4A20